MAIKDYVHKEETLKTAEQLFVKAKEDDLHKRLGEEKTEEAVTKIAARQEQEMIDNIEEMSYFDRRGLEKNVRKVARKLDEYAPQYKAEVYLKPFRESEEIPEEVIEKAEDILEETENSQNLIGKSATSKAAAAIYIAAVLTDNYMPNDKVVEIGDVSEPTLRKCYVIMLEELDQVETFLNNHPYPTRTTWKQGEN